MNLSILLDLYRSKWELSVAKEDTYGQTKNENDDKGSTTTEMEEQEQSSFITTMMETTKYITIEDTEMTAEYATTPENSRQIKETTKILW